ncbi:hypothetical protein ACRAWC_22175 [Leifsonia sp. L25]|uniref:hypothetical protein n=1 Tax=Leifsonia sp. L25 TaxID=3423957 RepID=UPI003D69AB82
MPGIPLLYGVLFLSGLGFALSLAALYAMVSAALPESSTPRPSAGSNTAGLMGGDRHRDRGRSGDVGRRAGAVPRGDRGLRRRGDAALAWASPAPGRLKASDAADSASSGPGQPSRHHP